MIENAKNRTKKLIKVIEMVI